MNQYYSKKDIDYSSQYVAPLTQEASGSLIMKTYLNVVGAVAAFTLITIGLFMGMGVENFVGFVTANSKAFMLVMILLCFGAPFLTQALIGPGASRAMQYTALGLYVLMEVAILAPILAFATIAFGLGIIFQAIGLSVSLFIALSAVVFMTRQDFSFLRSLLFFATIGSLITIVFAMIFHMSLGIFFCGLMVLLMGGYVLYETSTMLLHAGEDDDVRCAVMLFSTLMTLFFYILRILMIFAGGRR